MEALCAVRSIMIWWLTTLFFAAVQASYGSNQDVLSGNGVNNSLLNTAYNNFSSSFDGYQYDDSTTITQRILDYVPFGKSSQPVWKTCNTECYSITIGDSEQAYTICIYPSVNSGRRCTFSMTEERMNAVTEFIQSEVSRNDDLIGSSMILYKSKSTKVCVKWRNDSFSLMLGEIHCIGEII
ncbi:hypothetical protein V1504DRAFT_447640 [Lipomyces starkeyi]